MPIRDEGEITAASLAAPGLPALFLLFEKGDRPTRAVVRDMLGGSSRLFVTHDPSCNEDETADRDHSAVTGESFAWLELLCDGLTFDLLGLDGGPPLSSGPIAHRFGTANALDFGSLVAVGLFPGPHLAEGANSIPVIRTMLGVALELIEDFPDCRAVQWSPARAVISADLFKQIASEWLQGGPFPALGLIGYRSATDGYLESEGFEFLSGFEIAVSPELAQDRIAGTKLAVRVIHSLVGALPPESDLSFEYEGKALRLRPDDDRRLIFVEPT